MTPEQAVAEARKAELRPVYLLAGEERYLSSLVLGELRKATLGGLDLGLNDDQFDAGDADADTVLSAARTLPMMAKRRLVVVRSIERWEPKGEAKPDASPKSKGSALDRIAEYAAAPSPTTTLILVAGKLDARRRLVVLAKKDGFIVDCEAPSRNMLPSWIIRRAKDRGKTVSPAVAELLADIAGPELSRLDDAIERLSLYVGAEVEIGEDAVADAIVGVKPSSVWELVGAVGRRDLGTALAALARIYDPKDRGLPLLGTLAWSMRQLIKFQGATARGLSPPDAARHAGAPPFKAGELAAQVKQLGARDLERFLLVLADMDLALKGGSKRPARATIEASLVTLCRRSRSDDPVARA
ncbi:MAG TPA: DNA polymerase III subunit delta [Polyangiaceae bacterium]|nr:DNA polymerase III subunit delta [Polyangiaceae bacterium]